MLTIQALMQVKYPKADFGEYFRFLVSCAGTLRGLTHEHHIAPRKQFPELAEESENFITLTVTDHANAHRLLGVAVLELRKANAAWLASQGSQLRKIQSNIGKQQVLIHKKNRTNFYDPLVRAAGAALGGIAARAVCKERGTGVFSKKHQSKAASASGRKQAVLGLGCHAHGIHSKAGRISNHKRNHITKGLTSAECEFCQTK